MRRSLVWETIEEKLIGVNRRDEILLRFMEIKYDLKNKQVENWKKFGSELNFIEQ